MHRGRGRFRISGIIELTPIESENEAPNDATLSANTVPENSSNGTVIGTVTGVDPNPGATLSYSLTDDAGGRFAIGSSTGIVTVANGSLLDYESATSHDITVRVTDQSGLYFDKVFTIHVTDVVEVTPGSSTFDSGSGNFQVPAYNTLTVELWGPGGSGAGVNTTGSDVAASAGTNTTVSTLSLVGPAGNPASASAGGAAVTGTGGNTENATSTAGSNRGNPYGSGNGGASPHGGGTAASPNITGTNGTPGNAPGGGGSGARYTNAGSGGSGGGYAKSVYTRGVTSGAPNIGDLLAYTTGGSGNAGVGSGQTGGKGAAGRVKFTWS